MLLEAPPTVSIERRALAALRCYLEAVPGEVSGIGLVTDRGGGPHIAEVFILRQVSGWWETELHAGALAHFVAEFERRGGDPSQLCCWWHSHGDLEVSWSETDEATILAFPGEGLVSLVANRWGEVLCRLDRWGPGRETCRDVPLVTAGEPVSSFSLLALRAAIRAEVAALVRPAAVPLTEDIGIPP